MRVLLEGYYPLIIYRPKKEKIRSLFETGFFSALLL